MRVVDIITHKRDGRPLTKDAIAAFVSGVSDGSWPDYQISALLMAIMLNGMDEEETWHLTEAMVRSGDTVDLSDLPGPKVGKHSTGGVGDKVSIVLAPLVAACGVVTPKMSGRGLAHTGGTLDKLESIPGFRVDLSIEEVKSVLHDVGACIVGQTAALVPADKKIYSLRDVTATVESLPLIAASVMSKKLAEGSTALVLDVKMGSGGVMKNIDRARALAERMVAIGTRAGLPTEAVITEMDAPLGMTVGNALEIIECIDTLKGHGPGDLLEVVYRLATGMLRLGGAAHDAAAAKTAIDAALASGRALDRLRRMIARQGGDPRVVDEPSRLLLAEGREMLTADRGGYVTRIRASDIGTASNLLGAGRARAGDAIDHSVGLRLHVQQGAAVSRGDPLIEVFHRDGRGLEEARACCRRAFEIGDEPVTRASKILGDVR